MDKTIVNIVTIGLDLKLVTCPSLTNTPVFTTIPKHKIKADLLLSEIQGPRFCSSWTSVQHSELYYQNKRQTIKNTSNSKAFHKKKNSLSKTTSNAVRCSEFSGRLCLSRQTPSGTIVIHSDVSVEAEHSLSGVQGPFK